MHILVTGGAGYVGSSLVPLLLAQGHHVRILDHLERGGDTLISYCGNPRFDIVRGDISDEEVVVSALEDIDTIVHLAAVVGEPACRRAQKQAWATNVEGTDVLLGLRKTSQRMIFASTGSVYGRVPDGFCTENMTANPLSLYARSKLAAEELILEGGNAVVYRFSTAFGASPRMRFDLLPNDFTYQAVIRRSLVVYEHNSRRALIHVHDMARSIVFALLNWEVMVDRVYNIGNSSLNYTKAEVAECIKKYTDYYLHFAEFDSDPDQRDYLVSYERIEGMGFACTRDLNTAVPELIQAVRLLF